MAKPSEIFEDLLILHARREPAFIWGAPGVGKSELVAGLAKKLNIGLIDFRTALRDPTDLKGFPMPDQATKTMKFFRDAELPTKGKGILFMDELNSAPPTTQAAAMQLLLPPYAIGDYALPKDWWIVGAGNRESDRGVVHRMPSPLCNRLTHFDFDVDADNWKRWALDNEQTAEDIAFIAFRPSLLYTFDPKSTDRAFGTPRAWVKAFGQRAAATQEASAYRLVSGTVGAGQAAEYFGFLKVIKDVPSVDQIKIDPDGTKVPTQPATLHAITTALSMATTKVSAFSRFMKYVERLPVEFQAVYVRDAIKNESDITTSKEFTRWSLKNEAVLL